MIATALPLRTLLPAALFLGWSFSAHAQQTSPDQSVPWTSPKTSLPPLVVSAASELFQLGLPDPRGCKYREVEIARKPPAKIHGWVLPETDRQRYAIAWNGGIYPIVSAGKEASLEADFPVQPEQNRTNRFDGYGHIPVVGERETLSTDQRQPIQLAFLLRLGETKLAEQVWQSGCEGYSELLDEDPFIRMVSTWVGAPFDRAMTAYRGGHDAAAIGICRDLAPILAKVQAAAGARGLQEDWTRWASDEDVSQAPVIQAESERRLHEEPYVPVMESGKPASGPERIAALIRDLETVSVSQWISPGWTDPLCDPVVQALIDEGSPAVGPLLDCLEKDNRMTRSQFTESGYTGRPIIPVYTPAYIALCRILGIDGGVRDPVGLGGEQRSPLNLNSDNRKALAEKLRDFAQTVAGRSPAEVAYATLQDDNAGAKAWLQAVGEIVRPKDGTFTSYNLSPACPYIYSPHQGPAPFPMYGDSLRRKTNPSVSELISRRFWQLVQEAPQEKEKKDWDNLARLVLSYADWDGSANLDDLARMDRALMARPDALTEPNPSLSLENDIFEKRIELGDNAVVAEYAAWLQSLTPSDLNDYRDSAVSFFRIMWEHPDDPDMKRAAEKMFCENGSPWVAVITSNPSVIRPMILTPMIGMPAFRAGILRSLEDHSRAGTVTIRPNNYLEEQTASLDGHSSEQYDPGPLVPSVGSTVDFRLCDYYASQLSKLDECPDCELYWQESDREKTVTACQAFLDRYGNNFLYQQGDPYMPEFTNTPPRIHFPKLDHPATPDDVASGRAIFSFSGPARLCSPQNFPLPVSLKSHQAHIRLVNWYHGSVPTTLFLADDTVWQTEEELTNGEWHRVYGVVERHRMGKVDASEIRFLNEPSGGLPLTGPVFLKIKTPLNDIPVTFGNIFSLKNRLLNLGDPMPVQVNVFNESAVDQRVSGAILKPANAKGKTLPSGVSLSLAYSRELPPRMIRNNGVILKEPDYGNWQELPLKRDVKTAAKKADAATLSPAQELSVLSIDLKDYFDTSRPGTYRLRMRFHTGDGITAGPFEVLLPVADDKS